MEKLKPCPFCGGEAKIFTAQFGKEAEARYTVRCSDCPAEIGWEYFSAEACTIMWNRRAKDEAD